MVLASTTAMPLEVAVLALNEVGPLVADSVDVHELRYRRAPDGDEKVADEDGSASTPPLSADARSYVMEEQPMRTAFQLQASGRTRCTRRRRRGRRSLSAR